MASQIRKDVKWTGPDESMVYLRRCPLPFFRRVGILRLILYSLATLVVADVLNTFVIDGYQFHPSKNPQKGAIVVTQYAEFPKPALPKRLTYHQLCPKILKNDPAAILEAKEYMSKFPRSTLTPKDYINMTQHCGGFVKGRGYITTPLSQEEIDFPLAFSLVLYRDLEQAERLLRAIYMPQNLYCVHVDTKAPSDLYEAMESIVKCLPNVFMVSEREDIRWGQWSVLQADLNCMNDLYKRKKKWKYFINLTGQEMPMLSNRQLVRVLKAYNGSNDIEGTVKRRNLERFMYVYENNKRTARKKSSAPHGIQVTKGSVHIVASRGYVDYALHNKKAKDFLNWLKDTMIPDESFFSSLNHNPHLGVPGAYKGDPETHPKKKPFLTRFKNWGTWPFNYGECYGKRVRMVCVIGVGDLFFLKTRKELFVNKFHLSYQYLALDCWEQLHYNMTKKSVRPDFKFDDSYYRKLSYVLNKVKNPSYGAR